MTISSVEAGQTWTAWRQQLPADWAPMELRRVAEISASNVDKIAQEGEIAVRLCNYTDVYYHDVITPELDFMEATATPSEIARFRLRGGEVLLTKDSETAEDIAVPAYVMAGFEGVVCGYHLYLLRPHPEKVDGRFLMRACSVSPIKDQFVTAANGITRFGLGQQDLGSSLVPVPPLHVQRNVADFLDRETTKIDHLIEEKQRLIELLEEKRTALITRAVTKGLDPDVEMKDSGVEWLGEIPAHWKQGPLGRVTRAISGGTPDRGKREFWDGEVPWVSPKDMKVLNLEASTEGISQEAVRATGLRLIQPGAVLIVVRGMILDHTFPVAVGRVPLTINQDMKALITGRELLEDFLAFSLKGLAGAMLGLVDRAAHGTCKLNSDQWKAFAIPVPPREEQGHIAAFLHEREQASQGVADELTSSITLLREYRSALIAAAVTGKIDVREHAA